MLTLLGIFGVLLIVFLGGLGHLSGEVERVMEDPEVKERRERERAEEKRRQDWKDKIGRG